MIKNGTLVSCNIDFKGTKKNDIAISHIRGLRSRFCFGLSTTCKDMLLNT